MAPHPASMLCEDKTMPGSFNTTQKRDKAIGFCYDEEHDLPKFIQVWQHWDLKAWRQKDF